MGWVSDSCGGDEPTSQEYHAGQLTHVRALCNNTTRPQYLALIGEEESLSHLVHDDWKSYVKKARKDGRLPRLP